MSVVPDNDRHIYYFGISLSMFNSKQTTWELREKKYLQLWYNNESTIAELDKVSN